MNWPRPGGRNRERGEPEEELSKRGEYVMEIGKAPVRFVVGLAIVALVIRPFELPSQLA